MVWPMHHLTGLGKMTEWHMSKAVVMPSIVIALFSQAAVAQGRDVTCRTCEVQMVRVVGIPSAIGSIVIRHNPSIVRSKTRFVLAPAYGGAVAVFHDKGFTTIGRRGGGPEEFRDEFPIAMSVASSGEVYVVHGSRVSIVDVDKGGVVASFLLPYVPLTIANLGRELVATSFGSNAVSAFDQSGRALWTHQSSITLKGSDAIHVSASGDTAYWEASMYAYGARLIRRDGAVLKTVVRQPSWFKSNGMVPGEPLNAKPSPKIAGVVELGDGLLLFIIHVADSQWKAGPLRGLPIERMRPDEYFDTILEVVDSKDSRLITSTRYDQAVHLVRGSRYVWLLKETTDGDESFEIFEPRLGR